MYVCVCECMCGANIARPFTHIHTHAHARTRTHTHAHVRIHQVAPVGVSGARMLAPEEIGGRRNAVEKSNKEMDHADRKKHRKVSPAPLHCGLWTSVLCILCIEYWTVD